MTIDHEKDILLIADEYATLHSIKPDKEPLEYALPILFVCGISIAIFTGLAGLDSEKFGLSIIGGSIIPATFFYFIKKNEWDKYYRQHTNLFTSKLDELKAKQLKQDA